MNKKYIRLKDSRFWVRVALTLFMLIIGLVFLYPLLYMISGSLKNDTELSRYPFHWIPKQITNNYAYVFQKIDPGFGTYYLNSIYVTIVSIVGLVITSLLAAYGFSKIHFRGRNVLFLIYMMTLMIPSQVTMVPRFILYRMMGIYNTHLALILPGIFTAYGTFLLRQFMLTIPFELNESATIDGAGHLRILVQILLPVLQPAIVTLVLLSMVWSWNDYENAMLFLTKKDLFTVPIGLAQIFDNEIRIYSRMLAASACTIIPPLIVFIVGQKFFVNGLVAGAIKG